MNTYSIVSMGILDPLYTLFGWALHILYGWFSNYGVVIIVFTVILKLLMIPLHLKTQTGMIKTQLLSEDVQEIKRKYPNDKMKQGQLQQQLNKINGISTTSSCLFSIIQLLLIWPIIRIFQAPMQYIAGISSENIQKIADYLSTKGLITVGEAEKAVSSNIPLIRALQESGSALADVVNNGWMKVSDLFNTQFLGINLGLTPTWKPNVLFSAETRGTYLPLLLIPALVVLATLIQIRLTKINSLKKQQSKEEKKRAMYNPAKSGQGDVKDQTESMTRGMNFFMPIMMLITTFTMPAAMGVYWIISTLGFIVVLLLSYYLYTLPAKRKMAEREGYFSSKGENMKDVTEETSSAEDVIANIESKKRKSNKKK